MGKSNKSADLNKTSSKKSAPELPERDLDKVTGGFITVPDIKGPSKRDGHDDEIEIHG